MTLAEHLMSYEEDSPQSSPIPPAHNYSTGLSPSVSPEQPEHHQLLAAVAAAQEEHEAAVAGGAAAAAAMDAHSVQSFQSGSEGIHYPERKSTQSTPAPAAAPPLPPAPGSSTRGHSTGAYSQQDLVQEDCRCVKTLVSSLERSLEFYVKGVRSAVVTPSTSVEPSVAGEGESVHVGDSLSLHATAGSVPAAVVDPLEATEFVALIISVTRRNREQGTLQALLFDSSFDVFKTFTSFINPPLRYAPVLQVTGREDIQEMFDGFRVSVIRAIKQLVVVCSDAAAAQMAEGDSASAGGRHLLTLCLSAIRRECIVDELMTLLKNPVTSDITRKAVSECLFVISVNADPQLLEAEIHHDDSRHPLFAHQRQPLQITKQKNNSLFGDQLAEILPMAILEPDRDVRGYLCAVARDLTAKYPAAPTTIQFIPSLLKLLQADPSPDVRALCIGAVEDILRADDEVAGAEAKGQRPTKATASNSKKDIPLVSIIETVLGRFETRSESAEILEMLAKLVEAAACCACAVAQEDMFRVCSDHGIHTHLLSFLSRGESLASVSVRALRVLVERAPSHLSLAPRLVTNGALEYILNAVLRLKPIEDETSHQLSSIDHGAQREKITRQLLSVELAVLIGLVLLFSPQNRRKFQAVLSASNISPNTLGSQLHSAITQGDIDYFEELLIVDEEGYILNDTDTVEWEEDSQQPTQQSLHSIIDAQELRRHRRAAGTARWLSIEGSRRKHLQRGYLAFVLLGYVVFRVLRHSSTAGNGKQQGLGTAAAPVSAARSRTASVARRGSPSLSRHAESPVAGRGEPPFAAPGGDTAAREHSPGRQYYTPSGTSPVQRRTPMFPNLPQGIFSASFAKEQTMRHHTAEEIAARREEKMESFSAKDPMRNNFKNCFSLCTSLAKFYAPTGKATEKLGRGVTYTPVGGGLVVRSQKAHHRNPWDPRPVQRDQVCWMVDAVQEGDLFFFSIPLDAVTMSVFEAILAKADKHTITLRKAFLTTPQRMKGRRCFLNDMLTNIMPQIVTLLRRLMTFLDSQSETHVQMALSALPDVRDVHLEKTVNSGNLVRCIDYLTHHFAKSVPTAASLSALPQGKGLGDQSPIPLSPEDFGEVAPPDEHGAGAGGVDQSAAQRARSAPRGDQRLRMHFAELGLTGAVGGELFHDLSDTSLSSESDDERYFD